MLKFFPGRISFKFFSSILLPKFASEQLDVMQAKNDPTGIEMNPKRVIGDPVAIDQIRPQSIQYPIVGVMKYPGSPCPSRTAETIIIRKTPAPRHPIMAPMTSSGISLRWLCGNGGGGPVVGGGSGDMVTICGQLGSFGVS